MKRYEIKVQQMLNALQQMRVCVTLDLPADERADRLVKSIGDVVELVYTGDGVALSCLKNSIEKVEFYHPEDCALIRGLMRDIAEMLKNSCEWVLLYQCLIRGHFIMPISWNSFMVWLNTTTACMGMGVAITAANARKVHAYYRTTDRAWDEKVAALVMGEKSVRKFRKWDALRARLMGMITQAQKPSQPSHAK